MTDSMVQGTLRSEVLVRPGSGESIRVVKLGELMVDRAVTLDPRKYPDEIFDLYSIPAYDAGVHEIASGSKIGSSKQLIQPNDVLVSKIVPHIRRAWIVGEKDQKRQIASGEWMVFRGNDVDSKYLRYFFLSDLFHRKLLNTVAGVGGSLLRARPQLVKQISLRLPSLEEQRWIVAVLDQADAIRTKRRQILADLDELPRSLFAEMFGDPVSNSKGWEVGSLGKLGTFKNGLNFGKGESGQQLKVVGVGDFGTRFCLESFDDIATIPLNQLPDTDYLLKDGDVLFVRSNGNKALVGRSLLVYPDNEQVSYSGFCIRFRVNDRNDVNVVYLNSVLQSQSLRQRVLGRGRGSNISNLNQKMLQVVPIPLPPTSLQQEFARRVEAIAAARAKVERALALDDELFAALQSRAFRGAL